MTRPSTVEGAAAIRIRGVLPYGRFKGQNISGSHCMAASILWQVRPSPAGHRAPYVPAPSAPRRLLSVYFSGLRALMHCVFLLNKWFLRAGVGRGKNTDCMRGRAAVFYW